MSTMSNISMMSNMSNVSVVSGVSNMSKSISIDIQICRNMTNMSKSTLQTSTNMQKYVQIRRNIYKYAEIRTNMQKYVKGDPTNMYKHACMTNVYGPQSV